MSQTGAEKTTPGPRAGSIWHWPEGRGPWRRLLLFTVVAVAYGLGSEMALRLIEASGLQGVLFIPSGITVAFLLRLPRTSWWVVLVAAGLTEFVMDLGSGFSSAEALGFAAANVAEPLLGAAIVTTVCGPLDLSRRRHVLWYTLGAVLAGPALGAAIGAGADRLFGGDDFLTTFSQWWLGDALGVVLVGSAIVAWGSSPDRRSLFSKWGAALILGSIAITVTIFTLSDLPLVFSVLIGVVLAGALFGVRAVAMTSLAVATTLAVLLALDSGPLIVGLSQASALVLIKLQVGTFALAGLLIAAESQEREIATRRAAEAALMAEALERERQRAHDFAVQIQKGLLPDSPLQLPGLDIAARYEAASETLEVGGDWYDTIQLSDGRIGLVVGDIVGHGIDAMTSMGRLRTALSALAMHNDDAASVLSAVDEFVASPDGAGYATVFYAIVHPTERTIQYASAGHPPGLMVSSSGETTWLDGGQSEPLYGMRPAERRKQASMTYEPGTTLILYSDGLIERRGESLSVGLGRLEDIAKMLSGEEPQTICDQLIARFGVGGDREDDVVVMAMKTEEGRLAYHEVFPAVADELGRVRTSIRSWLDSQDLSSGVKDDLLIALGEAAANVVRHAYLDDAPGVMEIRVSARYGTLAVEVADRGSWRDPTGTSGSPGLGLGIIRSLTRDFRVDRGVAGTSVSFAIPTSDGPGSQI